MIKARFTGEVNDDKHVGVKLRSGVELFAIPGMAFPLVATMTKEWFDEYGDKYYALVEYDEGTDDLYLIGMAPLEKHNPPTDEGWKNHYMLISKYFRYWLNDSDKKMVLQCLTNEGKIALVDKDATEAGVLGDKNETALKELADKIDAIFQALSTATPDATNPMDNGAVYKAAVIAALTSSGFPISATFAQTATDTKSKIVTLK